MKKILFLLILLFLSAQSFALAWSASPVTIVSNQAFNSLANSIAAPSFNLVAGNQVFVSIFWYDTSTSVNTITDTAGNTYTLVDTVSNVNISGTALYYCTNAIANANNVVTVTWTGSNLYRYVIVDQRSGGLTSGALDSHSNLSNGNAGTNTSSITSNPVTSTTAGELIYACANVNSQNFTFVAGSGYTIALTEPVNKQFTTESQINSGITTASVSLASGSQLWNIVVGTFKPAATSTGSTYIINNAVVNNMVLN